jgi:hypothetical protein
MVSLARISNHIRDLPHWDHRTSSYAGKRNFSAALRLFANHRARLACHRRGSDNRVP